MTETLLVLVLLVSLLSPKGACNEASQNVIPRKQATFLQHGQPEPQVQLFGPTDARWMADVNAVLPSNERP